MAVWSPLTTHWAVNISDSDSRNGIAIDTIQHHHTATNNKYMALSLFAPGGRQVTPNYFIAGKEIWGIVPEDRRAWTSGSYQDDARSITYEILNLTNGPDWQFASDTLETVARLDADIANRYGIPFKHAMPGFIEHRNLYEWYGRSYATACAGPSFDINSIIQAAKNVAPVVTPDTIPEEDDMPIVFGRLNNGKRTEWMLVDPSYGSDLKVGEKRTETVIDGKGGKHAVVVFPGCMVTTSSVVGAAWGRSYRYAYKNVPIDLQRDAYVEVQNAARLSGIEYQKMYKSK